MFFFFFFVRQKTAYAMRISDWSSDVCSSDLKDPTFGLDAVWIAPGDADAATGQGYLVVDPGTVIATHLNHKLAQHSAELLGPDEVQSLLDGLQERAEHLVASLSPQPLPLTTLTQVLRGQIGRAHV